MRFQISFILVALCSLFIQAKGFSQTEATKPIEVTFDDLVSGRVVVHGKFAVPLGTPMLGQFRFFKKDPKYDDSSVEVTRIVNGKTEEAVVYDLDDRNRTVRVYDHFSWTSKGNEGFWYYEVLESTWPRKRFPFPQTFSGIVNQTGMPGYRTKICVFPAIMVHQLLPKTNPLDQVVGPKPNETRSVLSEDIVSGKVMLLGRLKAPVGDILKGDVEYTPSSSGQPWSIQVASENSATAKFVEQDVYFCDFDGTPQNHRDLREKGRWKDVNFYEKISWIGVPDALVSVGVEIKRDSTGYIWEKFRMRSTLVVCVPESQN